MPVVDAFTTFKNERTRFVPMERVTLKEILKAYNRWSVTAKAKKLKAEEIEKLCEEHFGDSRGKREYQHIRVFLDDDDLEEFDATQEPVSSEVMANHILNSENKVELVRGLIEDKRALSSEIDRYEEIIQTLSQLIAKAPCSSDAL